jgi:hypothetical protein
MIVRARWTAAALTVAVVLVAAGCSSSKKAAGHSTSTASKKPAGSSTAGAAPQSGAVAPTGTGAPADAGTKALVGAAYVTFFDPKASPAKTAGVLQHGPAFAATLDAAAKSSQAQGIAAKVSAVNLVRPDVAYVTFTLTQKGSALLTDSPGYAVRENGTWKVAAQTFCNLLQLQNAAPPACKDASITALPS